MKKARAFAMVMKRTDPSIQLVGCGPNGWSEWDEVVLDGLAELVDPAHPVGMAPGAPPHVPLVEGRRAAEARRLADRLLLLYPLAGSRR